MFWSSGFEAQFTESYLKRTEMFPASVKILNHNWTFGTAGKGRATLYAESCRRVFDWPGLVFISICCRDHCEVCKLRSLKWQRSCVWTKPNLKFRCLPVVLPQPWYITQQWYYWDWDGYTFKALCEILLQERCSGAFASVATADRWSWPP